MCFESFRTIRPDGSSRLDSPNWLSSASHIEVRGLSNRQVRVPWVHPLLGAFLSRWLGHQEEDGVKPTSEEASNQSELGAGITYINPSGTSIPGCHGNFVDTHAYYGVTNDQRSLQAFREQVRRLWRKWLSRRNRRGRVTWEMFARLEKRLPLPHPLEARPRSQVLARRTRCVSRARPGL